MTGGIAGGEAPRADMHVGQLSVTVEMARSLVDDQFPDWAELPIRPVEAEGTVNAIMRIGGGLAARFPLQPGDVEATRELLQREANAVRELLGRTRFPITEPVALGEPGHGYPLPWAVQTWVSGVTASEQDAAHSAGFAHDLAEFIADVRALDTRGRTFTGDNRGGELREHDEWMQTCFENSRGLLDVPRLAELWRELRELPRMAPDVMTHGDLIPGNVLVADGRLAGVLDLGGLAPADPALDLVAAWHLLDAGPRQLLREDLHCKDLEWRRGQAWAFEQAMGLVWYYAETNPTMSRLGRRTLDRLLAAESTG